MSVTRPPGEIRKRANRETPGHRRDMILVAARSCLSKKGTRGFTLKNIAAEARVSISLVSHYFGSCNGVLKAVFRSVMIETLPGDYQRAASLDDALANVQELVARHFSEDYYSRNNLLVWLPIYEEMLLNRRTRTALEKIEGEHVDLVATIFGDVVRLRGLRVEPHELAEEFLAFLDGLWLRWCTSERSNTERERGAALRFLEKALGSLANPETGLR